MDVAAMGRVWYLESQARARLGDAAGLVDSIRRVAKTGRDGGYYWRERYTADGGHGAQKYCEYPANLIRIVQRFLLGVDLRLDGSLALAPTAPTEFWKRGFGQRLAWRDRVLDYQMERGWFTGRYSGGMQEILVRLDTFHSGRMKVNGKTTTAERDGQMIRLTLPASPESKPCRFEVR